MCSGLFVGNVAVNFLHLEGRILHCILKYQRRSAQDAVFDGGLKIRIRQRQAFSPTTVEPCHISIPLSLEFVAL